MTETESDQRQNTGDDIDENVGSALRDARRRRGLDLADVARELRLPRTTVEHLEDGRLDCVAAIYRRGYITNYARLVGLDPGPLLERIGDDRPEPLRDVMPVPNTGQRFDRFLRFATYLLATTVIVPPLVYFFVIGGARLFEAEPVAVEDRAAEGVATEESRPGYRERIAGALALRPREEGREDESHLSASALPLNAIRTPVPAETAVADAPVPVDETPEPIAEIGLKLLADSWIEIESADGERMEFDLLRAGATRNYTGKPPFRVLLGRASAVNLMLDGRPYEFDGHDQAGVVELRVGLPPGDSAAGGGSGQPAD